MEKIVVVTVKLRGTENEIEHVKAVIASVSANEEVVGMYIEEKGLTAEEVERRRWAQS